MSNGRLFVVHVPREAILAALDGIVPSGFETIVFSQWNEDRDTMMIGIAENVPDANRPPQLFGELN